MTVRDVVGDGGGTGAGNDIMRFVSEGAETALRLTRTLRLTRKKVGSSDADMRVLFSTVPRWHVEQRRPCLAWCMVRAGRGAPCQCLDCCFCVFQAMSCAVVEASRARRFQTHLGFDAFGFLLLQLILQSLQFLFNRADFRPVFFKP